MEKFRKELELISKLKSGETICISSLTPLKRGSWSTSFTRMWYGEDRPKFISFIQDLIQKLRETYLNSFTRLVSSTSQSNLPTSISGTREELSNLLKISLPGIANLRMTYADTPNVADVVANLAKEVTEFLTHLDDEEKSTKGLDEKKNKEDEKKTETLKEETLKEGTLKEETLKEETLKEEILKKETFCSTKNLPNGEEGKKLFEMKRDTNFLQGVVDSKSDIGAFGALSSSGTPEAFRPSENKPSEISISCKPLDDFQIKVDSTCQTSNETLKMPERHYMQSPHPLKVSLTSVSSVKTTSPANSIGEYKNPLVLSNISCVTLAGSLEYAKHSTHSGPSVNPSLTSATPIPSGPTFTSIPSGPTVYSPPNLTSGFTPSSSFGSSFGSNSGTPIGPLSGTMPAFLPGIGANLTPLPILPSIFSSDRVLRHMTGKTQERKVPSNLFGSPLSQHNVLPSTFALSNMSLTADIHSKYNRQIDADLTPKSFGSGSGPEKKCGPGPSGPSTGRKGLNSPLDTNVNMKRDDQDHLRAANLGRKEHQVEQDRLAMLAQLDENKKRCCFGLISVPKFGKDTLRT